MPIIFIAYPRLSIMQRVSFLFILLFSLLAVSLTAQDTLPGITVKNLNGQIIVSWINKYKVPVTTINIQRSYDSLKNYTTIGSVLSPQNFENGYADTKPPYNKMYYRVFISFDGGSYKFSNVARPVRDPAEAIDPADTSFSYLSKDRDRSAMPTIFDPRNPNSKISPKTPLPNITNTDIITYPSKRIFTAKDNNVIIYLPDAETKKYTVKFFDELGVPLFELNKLHENYLIVEKVNFIHAGWFHFEIYENGKLVEKNKFYILKDGKNQQPPQN